MSNQAAHSVLRPSAAGEWTNCPGSVPMQIMHPEPENSAESLEGTCAHALAAQMVYAAARANTGFPNRELTIGTFDANNVEITDEMYKACAMYADDVRNVMQANSVFTPHIEEKIDCSVIHPVMFGTPDCWLYNQRAGELFVWDFKFGHDTVEALENWQMLCYVAAILVLLGIDGHTDQYLRVHIRVVQPRSYHRDGPIREWTRLASELRPYFNILSNAAHKAMAPNAPCVSGPWCKNCEGLKQLACETTIRAGMSAIDQIGRAQSVDLDNDRLGYALWQFRRAKKHAENLLTAMEEQAASRIHSGEYVPGFTAERAFGRKRWTIPAERVKALGAVFGVNLEKAESSVLTPNQARDAGIDAAVIKQYSETPMTGYKLVESDKSRAAAVFKKRR